MNVLCIIPVVDNSGAPKMMSWVSNQLVKRGHNVILLSLFSDKCEQKLNENIVFYSIGIEKSDNWLYRNTVQMKYLLKRIGFVINEYHVDHVLTFLDSTGYFLAVYNKLFWDKEKVKMIVSERSDPNRNKGIIKWVKELCMCFSDVVVFQTDEAKACYCQAIQNKGIIIPNPVIKPGYERVNFNDRKQIIVTVGRLYIRAKRQDVLIDAFEILSKKYPDLKLIIYGEGEDRKCIEDIIMSKRLVNVELAGYIKNVEESIRDSKAFILSSDYEGSPNSLIEAMSLGVPCIATDCSPGSIKELIKDTINGFIVPRGDPLAIVDKAIVLLENEEISNKISINATKIIDTFPEVLIADMWEEAFDCDYVL